jgi:hypothetical protein
MAYTIACSSLELQTRPRLRPVSLSLSMEGSLYTLEASVLHWNDFFCVKVENENIVKHSNYSSPML